MSEQAQDARRGQPDGVPSHGAHPTGSPIDRSQPNQSQPNQSQRNRSQPDQSQPDQSQPNQSQLDRSCSAGTRGVDVRPVTGAPGPFAADMAMARSGRVSRRVVVAGLLAALAGRAAWPESQHPESGAEDPAARPAAAAALASVRALREGCLCGACDGRGFIVRRTRVGTRPVGGGLRIPVFANIEGPCTRCEGAGCAAMERVRQLASAAVTRLLLVPEASGLRAEVLVATRRALDELLEAAAAPLARLTEEGARDALIRVRSGPVDLLLVLPPAKGSAGASRRGPTGAASGGVGGGGSAAGRATKVVTIDGVGVRIVGPHGAERVEGSWTALLGRLRLDSGEEASGSSAAADLVLDVLVLTTRANPPAPRAPSGSPSGGEGEPRSRPKPPVRSKAMP